MDLQSARTLLRRLRRDGFDQSRGFRQYGQYGVRVRCSQCAALFINGMACHETGCPNARKRRKR